MVDIVIMMKYTEYKYLLAHPSLYLNFFKNCKFK